MVQIRNKVTLNPEGQSAGYLRVGLTSKADSHNPTPSKQSPLIRKLLLQTILSRLQLTGELQLRVTSPPQRGRNATPAATVSRLHSNSSIALKIPPTTMPIFDPGSPSGEFRVQWTHPGDVFSILLLLGGDVIARALAQLTGNRLAPVSFSFGKASSSPPSIRLFKDGSQRSLIN